MVRCTVETLAQAAEEQGIGKTALVLAGRFLKARASAPDFMTRRFPTDTGRGGNEAREDHFLHRGRGGRRRPHPGGALPRALGGERASTWRLIPVIRSIPVPVGREAFAHADVLLFVGACGIAVRSIAPHLSGKATDPAVVVVDDQGKFAVSLLSGHLGGANALAREVADLLDATPVITTATDGAGCCCVDLWAQQQGLAILGLPEAKAISAALLAGRPVGFRSAFPVEGDLPRGFVWAEGGETGVCVTTGREAPFDTTLRLVPPVVSLGVGCRKGAPAPAIAAAVDRALKEYGVAPEAVVGVYSLDLNNTSRGWRTSAPSGAGPSRRFPPRR